MILLLHILIAISSLAYTTYLFFFPSKNGLSVAQYLVVATLVSGTYLVLLNPVTLAHVCLTGLGYLALVGAGMVLVHRRLHSFF